LRIRCECQGGTKKDRAEEASVHKRDGSGARAECQCGSGYVRRFSTRWALRLWQIRAAPGHVGVCLRLAKQHRAVK
jgi:hypothetical protein